MRLRGHRQKTIDVMNRQRRRHGGSARSRSPAGRRRDRGGAPRPHGNRGEPDQGHDHLARAPRVPNLGIGERSDRRGARAAKAQRLARRSPSRRPRSDCGKSRRRRRSRPRRATSSSGSICCVATISRRERRGPVKGLRWYPSSDRKDANWSGEMRKTRPGFAAIRIDEELNPKDSRFVFRGEDLSDVGITRGGKSGGIVVNFKFRSDRKNDFGDFTEANMNRPLAIILNGVLDTSPISTLASTATASSKQPARRLSDRGCEAARHRAGDRLAPGEAPPHRGGAHGPQASARTRSNLVFGPRRSGWRATVLFMLPLLSPRGESRRSRSA